jgi:uncharacterized protein with ATP-grasp and redox domains
VPFARRNALSFTPSTAAIQVLNQAREAGLITHHDVDAILLLAVDGNSIDFNQRLSALARKLEGNRS